MALGTATARDLLTYEEACEILGKDPRGAQQEVVIRALISGVSQACETFLGRPILFGTYTFDGTSGNWPLVSGSGTNKLLLPVRPIKAITTFRRTDATEDFVEGSIDTANADYVLDRDAGIAIFHKGETPRLPNLYSMVIEGGYERGLSTAAEAARRGWPEGNFDLWLSVANELRHQWKRLTQNREDIQSVSVDGMTTTYIGAGLMKETVRTWRANRDWRA